MIKHIVKGAMVAATLAGTSALAQVNLTAETASPGGATYLSPAHLTEIAGTQGIANIQLADGQTLTNSIQNVAEGKTDIAGTPFILPFLMSRGVGPYGSLGAEQGAELCRILEAARLRDGRAREAALTASLRRHVDEAAQATEAS